MRQLPSFLRVLLATSAFVVANPARAVPPEPVPSLDLRGFRPSTDPAGGLFIEPVSTPAHGDANVGLSLSYAYLPVQLGEIYTGERFRVITHQLTGDLVGSIGAFGRLSLGADLPFIIAQTGDTPTDRSAYALGPTNIPERAFGDVAFTAKLVLVKPTAGKMGGFALALHDRFTVPTGDRGSFLGEGHITNTARLLAELRFLVLGVHLAGGVKLRAESERFACANVPLDPEDECPQRFGHELPYSFGLSFRPQALGIDPRGRWTFLLEGQGHFPLYPIGPIGTDPQIRALEIGAGARLALGDMYVTGGISGGVFGVGSGQMRAMLTLGYAPRVRDEDGDGVPDEDDQCRELPEDKDGFEDQDGCPDGDNDNDGVPDGEDQCPKQKEDEDGIDDDDGCPERAWGT
ncbi:MAG: thrombospondin type 3 repeat-containing protein [Polyangiaceae bacterium]|nr:thrombospondin type 3 repeat-containing protein [Polyangiaceae bacterium]